MPELDIHIGGRVFQVACQAGEEPFLQAAAALMDAEAQPLVAQGGRMPDARMLLMAGLMLADRLAGLEDRLRTTEAELQALASRPLPAPERIEVPVEVPVEIAVLPPGLVDRIASLAAEAEALADEMENRAGALADRHA